MRKLVLWQKVVIGSVLALLLGSGLGWYFYSNYQDDRTLTRDVNAGAMSIRRAVTKLQVARFNMSRATSVVHYISRCKRFPESFQGFFEPIEGEKPKYCKPLKAQGNRHNWLDPWDRPYQIRYDRKRAKLQIRSLGRYWWWPWDNIEDETYFNGALYQEQLNYCKQVPSSDMTCIFNRGWH